MFIETSTLNKTVAPQNPPVLKGIIVQHQIRYI